MNIEISKQAQKALKRQDEQSRTRMLYNISKLAKEPPEGDIKPLIGQVNMYRMRVGDFRILFTIEADHIWIDRILPRGQAYK